MAELEYLKNFLHEGTDDLNVAFVLINFSLAMITSFAVRAFYINYSLSLTGKMHIGSIIPILTAIVFLVIIVVKSSLALSLGLVGALSIVRFRTPIKEPEELVYLFLAIAIGLGFGAGYAIITTLLSLLTLGIIYFGLSNKTTKNVEYNLVVNWTNSKIEYEKIFSLISEHVTSLKLVRYEHSDTMSNSIFTLELKKETDLDLLCRQLKSLDETVNITFHESKVNW